MITSLGPVPFTDRRLLLTFDSCGLLMTLEVNEVAVSHSCVALRLLAQVRAGTSPLSERKLLGEDVDAHDLTRLGCEALLACDALWALLLLHVLHLGEELVRRAFLLHSHLGGHFRLLRPLKLLLLFLLDCLMQECSDLLMSHLVCQQFDAVLRQKDQLHRFEFLLTQGVQLLDQSASGQHLL